VMRLGFRKPRELATTEWTSKSGLRSAVYGLQSLPAGEHRKDVQRVASHDQDRRL
jgi:hypothetical protein